ncbi:MAG TPA: protein-disulfide reductase DsbD domain-containing protein [Terriglobia bacterium]
MRRPKLAAISPGLIWLLFFCVPPGSGAEALVQSAPHTKLGLLSETDFVEPGQTLNLGLLFEIEPHWHIYWINPGDSGEPPRVKWALPPGFRAGDLEWPAPARLASGPLTDYGYQGRVLLMSPVRVPHQLSALEVMISVQVQWLVCSDICIPAKASISLELPVGHAAPSPPEDQAALFRAARESLPRPLPPGWRVSADDLGGAFRIRLVTGAKIQRVSFFPLEFNQVENSKPEISTPLPNGVEVVVSKSDQLLQPVDNLRGVLVIDGGGSYHVSAAVRQGISREGRERASPATL